MVPSAPRKLLVRKAQTGVPPVEAVRTPACDPAIPLLRSEDLFGKAREILIEHSGGFYRLRVTHSNKLILTK